MEARKRTQRQAQEPSGASSAPAEADLDSRIAELERAIMMCCAPGNVPYSRRRMGAR